MVQLPGHDIASSCALRLLCTTQPLALQGAGNKIQVLAWEHANPAVKAQIHELRGVYNNRLTPFEYSLRLPLMVVDAIILEQHLGRARATEFIRAVDPWFIAYRLVISREQRQGQRQVPNLNLAVPFLFAG